MRPKEEPLRLGKFAKTQKIPSCVLAFIFSMLAIYRSLFHHFPSEKKNKEENMAIHTDQIRINSAYQAGQAKMEALLSTHFFQHPTMPAMLGDNEDLEQTSTAAGVTKLLGGTTMVAVTIPMIKSSAWWLLGSAGGVGVALTGVLFLTKDTPYPKQFAGHLMALKERVSIAAAHCLCRRQRGD